MLVLHYYAISVGLAFCVKDGMRFFFLLLSLL
jgi:hypothetical protein